MTRRAFRTRREASSRGSPSVSVRFNRIKLSRSTRKRFFEHLPRSFDVTPFAYIGPDCSIPTTNLTLNPLNQNKVLVGSVSWSAYIVYQDHGRNDRSQTFTGSSAVWSPIPIDFQGIVQGGDIFLSVSAQVKDIKTGVVVTQTWSGQSVIRGTNPDKTSAKSRLSTGDSLAHQVIAYKESLPKWCQFDGAGLPSFGQPSGFRNYATRSSSDTATHLGLASQRGFRRNPV